MGAQLLHSAGIVGARQIDVPRSHTQLGRPRPGRRRLRLRHGVCRRLPQPQSRAGRCGRSALADDALGARPLRLYGDRRLARRRCGPLSSATTAFARPEPGPRSPLGQRRARPRATVANSCAAAWSAGRARLLLRRRKISAPRRCTSSRVGRRPLRRCRLGADGPCLRRIRGAADATRVAHLRAPDGRCPGMAGAVHRRPGAEFRGGQRVRRAFRRLRRGLPWAGFAWPASPIRAT